MPDLDWDRLYSEMEKVKEYKETRSETGDIMEDLFRDLDREARYKEAIALTDPFFYERFFNRTKVYSKVI